MGGDGFVRSRGVLSGFVNSADLGGLPLPGGRLIPPRRILRANTPEHLTSDELQASTGFGFGTVIDLRSFDERLACRHPFAQLPGYRQLPLIDPAAEAKEDLSQYRTLGEIYSSSLQRNATHIAAIFAALAAANPGPILVSCRAGRDRTGMISGSRHRLVRLDPRLPALAGPRVRSHRHASATP